jgi:hypothetical protein
MKLMQICGLTPITLALAGEGWSMACKLWHSVWSEAGGSQPGILSTTSNKASHNSCSGAGAHRLWTWRCSRGRSRRARPSPSGPRTLCLALSRPPSWTLCHVHRRQTVFDGLLKWQEQWLQPVQYCPSFQKTIEHCLSAMNVAECSAGWSGQGQAKGSWTTGWRTSTPTPATTAPSGSQSMSAGTTAGIVGSFIARRAQDTRLRSPGFRSHRVSEFAGHASAFSSQSKRNWGQTTDLH